jgi:hypothetical protein
MEAASMVTSTEERVRSCGSSWIAPAHLAKRPCTFEMIMWRTWKWMAEWLTSMSQGFVMFVPFPVRERGAR